MIESSENRSLDVIGDNDVPMLKHDVLRRFLKDQRLLFIVVGGANTIFATVLFALLLRLLGPNVPSVVSLSIAWVVSLLTGFMAHRWLVFRVAGKFWLDLIRFAGVNYITFLINLGVLALLSDFLGLPALPVQIGVVFFAIAFTYFGHRYFSFRR